MTLSVPWEASFGAVEMQRTALRMKRALMGRPVLAVWHSQEDLAGFERGLPASERCLVGEDGFLDPAPRLEHLVDPSINQVAGTVLMTSDPDFASTLKAGVIR